MATKDELVAFGQARGVAVDMSMLKSDIEAAIADAGYDPPGEATTMGTEETEPTDAEDVAGTSSDAQFSTYEEAPAVDPGGSEHPPSGRQVEQTRGVPSEGGGTVFNANR